MSRLRSGPQPRGRGAGAIAALLALVLLSSCGSSTEPTRIVLITVDTLRADALDAEAMPRTHAFLERGTLFPVSFAATTTTQPTHATLLTGLAPWATGVTRNGVVLAEERETLAERLHAAGYSTHAVVASFPLHERFGFAQGFDTFHDDFDVPYVRVWEGQPTEAGTFYSLGESVTDQALAALDAAEGERQFFWFHYFDPHDPYGDAVGAPLPIQRLLALAAEGSEELPDALRRAREGYHRDLGALDRSLARLLDRLQETDDGRRTLVLLTGDHGESFGERGALGHGKRLTPEQVEVPLGLVGTDVPAEHRSDPSGSVDAARTVLLWAGVDATGFGGSDLLGSAPPEAAFGMRRTFVGAKEEILTDGTRRLLPASSFFFATGREFVAGDAAQLLDDDDPAHPYSGPRTEEIRHVFSSFGRLLDRTGTGEELLDEDSQAALRALGYGR